MVYAVPGEEFEFTIYGWATGLEGTLGWRIEDNGDVILARSTDGVVESPAGSGVYQIVAGPAPAQLGHFSLILDDGAADFRAEDLVVTGAFQTGAVIPAGLSPRALCTVEDVIDALGYDEAEAAARANTIIRTINSASSAIPRRAQREFICVPTEQERMYLLEYADIRRRAARLGDMKIAPDVVTLVDRDNDLDYPFAETDWYVTPDVREPGFPYEYIRFKSTSTVPLRTGFWLRVEGSWGFEEIPDDIRQIAIGTAVLWILNDTTKLAEVARAQGRRVRLESLIPTEFVEAVEEYRTYRVA